MIAQALRNEAARREKSGEYGHHQVAAYRKAADEVAMCGQEVGTLYREGKVLEIPGVGPSIARFLADLLDPDGE